MPDCDGRCSDHGALATDLRWLKWGLYGGIGLLFSAIVYFNNSLHAAMIKGQESTSQVQALLMESRSQHALELAKVENKVNSLSSLCCDELTNYKQPMWQ